MFNMLRNPQRKWNFHSPNFASLMEHSKKLGKTSFFYSTHGHDQNPLITCYVGYDFPFSQNITLTLSPRTDWNGKRINWKKQINIKQVIIDTHSLFVTAQGRNCTDCRLFGNLPFPTQQSTSILLRKASFCDDTENIANVFCTLFSSLLCILFSKHWVQQEGVERSMVKSKQNSQRKHFGHRQSCAIDSNASLLLLRWIGFSLFGLAGPNFLKLWPLPKKNIWIFYRYSFVSSFQSNLIGQSVQMDEWRNSWTSSSFHREPLKSA